MLSNPFPYDEVANYDFGPFKLFNLTTEITYHVGGATGWSVKSSYNSTPTAACVTAEEFLQECTKVEITRETVVVSRVFTQEAQDLLSTFKPNTQGKVAAVILLRAMYEAMTGERMRLRDASFIFDFCFYNTPSLGETTTWSKKDE